MRLRCRVTFAVVLVAAPALLVSPASAKGTDPPTVPGTPTIIGVTAGRHRVSLSFTPPADNGGARILHYRARCTPIGGGATKTGYSHTTPIFVDGLAAGKSYSCTLAASNRIGFGPASAPVTTSVDPNAGTRCATASGTATFTPPIPKLGDKTRVSSTLTMSGTISGCTGGGVTSGTTSSVSPPTESNCSTVATYSTTPITATLTITWDTNATSTVALQLHSVKGSLTARTLTGTVSDGLFKGLRLTGSTVFLLSKLGCVKEELSTLSYKQLAPTVIS